MLYFKNKNYWWLFITMLLAAHTPLLAQGDVDYQLATRLMQQQKFEEALPLFQKITGSHPANYYYSQGLVECLIQLKQYDEGLKEAARFQNHPQFESQAKIRIGEIHHLKGEKELAFEIWQDNLQKFESQLQVYLNTASVMMERREYISAVEVFKAARSFFKNERMFFGEIANAYMQAGEYEMAINEWLNLLESAPEQLSFVQRSLLRYDDPLLYDITIAELALRLRTMTAANAAYHPFYQMQIWLLQENKLYRRALAAAKAYENASPTNNYAVFNLGRQLSNQNEFELAVEAFSFYIENNAGEVRWRNMEELANTYSKWAKYIDDYQLDFYNTRDSLFTLSASLLDAIISQTSHYSRQHLVYLKKAELSLDYLFNLESAESAAMKLMEIDNMREAPEAAYLQGRIHIAKQEFPLARVSLTKANKLANIGELAEKTRYFLALTDFYAGDYEFAEIQLKALGRQKTSFYANDALELRLWLQEGNIGDSTFAELHAFADAVYKAHNGQEKESAERFKAFIHNPGFSALKDDALLLLLQSGQVSDTEKLAELSYFLAAKPLSAKTEKLLWKQARLAEITGLSISKSCSLPANCLSTDNTGNSFTAREIYEEIILTWPQGFYAPFARQRLSNLINTREHS